MCRKRNRDARKNIDVEQKLTLTLSEKADVYIITITISPRGSPLLNYYQNEIGFKVGNGKSRKRNRDARKNIAVEQTQTLTLSGKAMQ